MSSECMEHSVSFLAVDIQWGWTALHCAANVGMVKVAEELLKKRASPYVKSLVRFEELSLKGRSEADHRSVSFFFQSSPALLYHIVVPRLRQLLHFCMFFVTGNV